MDTSPSGSRGQFGSTTRSRITIFCQIVRDSPTPTRPHWRGGDGRRIRQLLHARAVDDGERAQHAAQINACACGGLAEQATRPTKPTRGSVCTRKLRS
jgi:hypothetical protein